MSNTLPSTKPIRAGVIGLGVGEAHAEALASHPHCTLQALCDLDPQRLTRAKEKFPLVPLCTPAAEELISHPDIDLVVIASYDSAHFGQARLALERGKHLLVEKPCCTSRAELRALEALLSKHPQLHFSSNLILRRSPRFLRLKKLIGEGALGELYCVEGDYNYGRLEKITTGWRGQDPHYSAVLGGGVHTVDLLSWLLNSSIVSVTATSTKLPNQYAHFRGLQTVLALLKFSSGAVGKLGVNFPCVYPHTHRLALYGSSGTFENCASGALLYTARGDNTEPTKIEEPVRCHKGELVSRFVDEVIGAQPPDITPAEIFRAMDVCFDIEEQIHATRATGS